MRRALLLTVAAGGMLLAGTAVAAAKDGRDRVATPPGGPAFELRIDPELDARFGPRPVNAVQAAEIVTARFGGQVTRAELDEANGRPIWEIDLSGARVGEVDVDAIDGTVLGGEAGDD
ncbi:MULTISPECIES: PepSY domain-containing protein [unclassified Micromonospora]|uniref:PepSY domain-containing protein n=1 Tax=unclassified Micromonospora TaxID=2617518 RepID=UPI002FF1BA99